MYADVIVPLPLPATFTYRVPEDLAHILRPMMRVVVPFGSRRFYTAIVVELTERKPEGYEVKDILMCPDTEPILRHPQLKLWHWISEYYMCAIGDVFKAGMPAGLKIESETIVEISPDFVPDADTHFTPKMIALYERLKALGSCPVRQFEKEGLKGAMQVVYDLFDIGAVTVHEILSERFRPKKEEYIRITLDRSNPDALTDAFSALRSQRHQTLLMKLIQLSSFTRKSQDLKEIAVEALKDDETFDRAVLRSFVKKGFISIEKRDTSRFKWDGRPLKPKPDLSKAQKAALGEIHARFLEHPVTLLHGVTSSGKTEIYIHLIDYTLQNGKQALFLVPEIALTTQLTQRLQDVFGSKVVIYHSRFSDIERGEIWLKMLRTNEPLVVIGARSALFLPFASLGLVIVDEEHEPSYKQYDPAPRYNGRDVAIVLSRMHGARTLLGSATPSVETYHKALEGRYGLVTLSERYAGASLPAIEIVDTGCAQKQRTLHGSLTSETISLIRHAVEDGRQAIVFHNRRGFSPIARCRSCEYIPRCDDCDVSLSYHRAINRLVCHYCGRTYPLPTLCPVCATPAVEVVGFGTERIEDEVERTFPNAKTLRMDLDTTRDKDSYGNIIDRFSARKADILVGTQMVTKGLDFGGVSAVAVLNADILINHPDFRATERAYNMLEQVSGRAGRRDSAQGKVLIQTRQPRHPLLHYVLNHDYQGFFRHEIGVRRQFAYPPFVRLIYIYVRHKDENLCIQASETLAAELRGKLGNRVLGPQQPPVSRIKTLHIRRLMIKTEPQVSITQVKDIVRTASDALRANTELRNIDIYYDVDPV